MSLERLLGKFPPNEEENSWVGCVRGLEWRLELDSLSGWQLFITFWVSGKAFYLQGIMKGETLRDAIQETILWVRQFRDSLLQLHDSTALFAPSTALERVFEGD